MKIKSFIISLLTPVICSLVTSCDYFTVKKENDQLKEERAYSDSIIEAYRYKEQQEEYIKMMKKYAVYVIKYNQCKAWKSSDCIEWDTFYRTDIVEVPAILSEDDKYRILDEHSSLLYSDDYIISREFFVFDSYTEASKKKNEYGRKE